MTRRAMRSGVTQRHQEERGTTKRPSGRALALAATLAIVSGCSVPVAAALDEGDANRVVVVLDESGIDAVKEADPQSEGKFRVTVPRDDASRALATMHEEQLPRPRARGLLEASDHGQLVPSQAAEHAQLSLGLAGELERTLGNVDGVLSARVHLNLPARDALRDAPIAKATASVLVEHRGATPPLAPESIQRLVSGGAPNLAPADVAVVFVPRAARPTAARAELAHVGPIAVARASATTLKAALAGLVLVVLVLAASVLALYAKIARQKREQEALVAGFAGGHGPGAGPGSRTHGAVSGRPPHGHGP